MKALFKKTLGGLRPVGECKAYDKLELNDQIEIDIKMARNYKFHKKMFALIKLCYENQEHYNNMEHLRKDLIKAAGFYSERKNHISGETSLEADSISFSSMDEAEFSEVYNRVLDVVSELLGSNSEEIRDEVLQFG